MATTIIQTFALSGHIIEDTGNLVRVGPESAAQFLRVRDATVTYQVTTGGPIYTDTVPGLQAAVVYGSSPAVTTVDARVARYVTFIVPAYGGTAPLQVATEGAYNYIAQQGYVIPLDICFLQHWHYYQNTGGVVLPPPGGSWLGGASLGAFDTRSWQGGGSVSGIAISYGTNNVDRHGLAAGVFFKFPSAPTGDMTLLDFNTGANGFLRVKLGTTLAVTMELSITSLGAGSVAAVQPNILLPNTWYWLAVGMDKTSNAPGNPACQVTGPGGTIMGNGEIAVSNYFVAYTSVVAVGVPSSSAYLAWPNASGWAMSKFRMSGNTPFTSPTYLPVSSADIAGDTIDLMGRDGIGAQTQLLDTSGSSPANNLSAGAQGLTVLAAGPYA